MRATQAYCDCWATGHGPQCVANAPLEFADSKVNDSETLRGVDVLAAAKLAEIRRGPLTEGHKTRRKQAQTASGKRDSVWVVTCSRWVAL